LLCITVFCIAFTACAQTKKTGVTAQGSKAKKVNDNVVLLQATKQKTLPGRPEMEPTTDYRFVIVWKSAEEPQGVFWRSADGGWQVCNIYKVTKYTPFNEERPGMELNYESVDVEGRVNANDTLELYPITGGKHPMPEQIARDARNTIFYKTQNSDWKARKVEKITEKPDIVMP
ncbi:MAG: hypothetical protein KDC11_03055, partial [Chitinophagaceae bacterium]|nr:hypothetical protein [Chitinophagaceae bacterium]